MSDDHVRAAGLVEREALCVRAVERVEAQVGRVRLHSHVVEERRERDAAPGHVGHAPAGHALEVAHEIGLGKRSEVRQRQRGRRVDEAVDGEPVVGLAHRGQRARDRVDAEATGRRQERGDARAVVERDRAQEPLEARLHLGAPDDACRADAEHAEEDSAADGCALRRLRLVDIGHRADHTFHLGRADVTPEQSPLETLVFQMIFSSRRYLRGRGEVDRHPLGHRTEDLGRLAVGVDRGDRTAVVTALAQRRDQRHLGEQGNAETIGEHLAAAAAEQLVARAVVGGEPRHVLDDALHLEVHLLGHEPGSLRHRLSRRLRCRDHVGLGARQVLRERERDVAGAGGQVEQQEVGVVPVDIGEELLERLVQHRPAPDDWLIVASEEAHRDAAHAPRLGRQQHLVDHHRFAVGAQHARDREAVDVGVDHTDRVAAAEPARPPGSS